MQPACMSDGAMNQFRLLNLEYLLHREMATEYRIGLPRNLAKCGLCACLYLSTATS